MRRILVTGANKGIGLAIVTAILEEHDDAFVFLGSRDSARGEGARRGLVQAHPEWADRVEVLPLDVASDASVAAAARTVAARFPGEATPLYGIVNNAGVGLGSTDRRGVIDVNVNGIRRVCEAFIPLLRPDGGRVVDVTSASGPMFVSGCSPERRRFFLDATIDERDFAAFVDECMRLDDAELSTRGLGGDAYGLSKAIANLYTLVLARRHPNLRINACTPGYIETDMTRPHARARGRTPEQMGMKPPSAGARAPMFLLFGEPEGTGHYYGSDARRSPFDRYREPGSPPHTGEP